MGTGFAEYAEYDGLGLAELIGRGEISAAEALDAALARADAHNGELNAIILDLRDRAREQLEQPLPDGPFAGVPFLLKDLSNALAGVPRTSGSRYLRDFVPDFDSELVKRYKRAGLVIFGKTNTPEFGTMPITDPELFGSARNPWNTALTPGGSSGGSASAVAARIVPIANGGDGGGSIRIPASCCGLVGLKPSRGRLPVGPEMGESWFGLATEHVLTRSVRDTAAMLDATHGPDVGAPYEATPNPDGSFLEEVGRDPGRLRIAFTTADWLGRGLHPDCVAGVKATAQKLADLGHHVEEADPGVDRDDFIYAMGTLIGADIASTIRRYATATGRKPRRQDFEPHNWALYKLGQAFTAADLAAALEYMHGVGRHMAHFMQSHDLLLTSALGMPPVECGALKAKGAEALMLQLINRLPLGKLATNRDLLIQNYAPVFDWIPTTPIANATGQPSMSLPLHMSEQGMPVGMMLTGRLGDEATVLRVAAQLEQAHPWEQNRPKGF